MPRVVPIWIAIAIAGCSRSPSRSVEGPLAFDAQRPDVPFVVFHKYQAYSAPGQQVMGGPVVAVWSDGQIVLAASEASIGRQYVGGRLSADQVSQVLAFIQAHPALLHLPRGSVLLDAAGESVGIRLAGARVLYGETVEDSRQIQHDADVAALRKYLLSLTVLDAHDSSAPWTVPQEDWYRR